MPTFRAVVCLALAFAASSLFFLARADTLSATFYSSPNQIAVGQLSLTTNSNGSISGLIQMAPTYSTGAFCFNVPGSIAGFAFSGIPANWQGDAVHGSNGISGCSVSRFGFFDAFLGTTLSSQSLVLVPFTVTRTAGFSSVYDIVGFYLLDPEPNLPVNFAIDVYTSGPGTGFGQDVTAGALAPTPEPQTLALFAAVLPFLLLRFRQR